jgi:glutamate 5-kinase
MARRGKIAQASRIVVKVGSSSLTTTEGGLDERLLTALVDTLAKAKAAGTEIVLVSSGAIAAGLAPLSLRRRPKALAAQQAAAGVGQGILVAQYSAAFATHGHTVGQVLLTVDDLTRRAHYRNAYTTLQELLKFGVVPIVNENDTVATHEIRFGDNDRLAALVAQLIHADALVLLSDVDALYDGDPGRPGTRPIPEVRDVADLEGIDVRRPGRSGLGSGGMQTKVDAATIATGAGIDVVLASAPEAAAALSGEPVGTLFHARTTRRAKRHLLWLEHAAAGRGTLRLDDGAVRAITERRKSLLPPGITAVEGAFAAGDPVDLADSVGHTIARGVVNYDSEELPNIIGRSTMELAREFGPEYEREVVHRDDLVVLPHRGPGAR